MRPAFEVLILSRTGRAEAAYDAFLGAFIL